MFGFSLKQNKCQVFTDCLRKYIGLFKFKEGNHTKFRRQSVID